MVAGGLAAKAGIEIDAIIVVVGGVNVERESAAQVVERVQQLQDKGVSLIVKDPYAFNDALNIPTKLEASSAVAPAQRRSWRRSSAAQTRSTAAAAARQRRTATSSR